MITSPVEPRRREAAVLALTVAWLLVVAIAAPPFAVGVESPEPDQETTVSVERSAYWTTPAPRTAPETLRQEFPPGVVCIVVPELCSEGAEGFTEPIEEGLTGAQESSEPEPVQPVPEDTLPVGVLFGEDRYVSGLQFATPPIPEGEQPTVVELVLEVEVEPTGVESPVFREAVAAAVGEIAKNQAGEDPSPEPFLDVLAETAEGETEPVAELDPPDLVVCGAAEGWEEGENQDVEDLPATDNCIIGGDAEPVDEDGEAWAFDITAAVTAWTDDDPEFGRENHGVLIMPGITPPLDYGDPDYTTNFLAGFAEPEEAEVRFATTEAFDGFADDGGTEDDFAEDDFTEDDFAEDDFTDDGFDDDLAGDEIGEPVQPDTVGPVDTGGGEAAADSPDVAAAPAPEPEPEVSGGAPGEAVDARTEPETPWYVWLLLPVGLGGAWWFSRLHEVDVPAELGGGEEAGAMSRLVQRRRGG